MTAEVAPIADPDAFAAEWSRFAARAGNTSVFQSAPWMTTWLAHAAPACTLHAVRVGDDALGVVGVRAGGVRSGAGARLAETGDDALDAIYVEYNDLLVTPNAPGDVRRRAMSALIRDLGVQTIILRNVTPPLRQAALSAGRDAGWVVRVVMEQPCLAADLTAPLVLSRNTRQQVSRARRLYEERGPLRVAFAETPASRAAALPDLIALHDAVWRGRGQTGAFTPAMRTFHDGLIARDDAPAEVLTLRAGDDLIGALYILRHNDTVYNYQSGFVVEADNRLKPGLLTHVMAMEHYARQGASAYDMMAGDARYKRSLGRPTKRLSVLELSKPSLRQKLRGVARNIRR